ncbi:MAG: metal-sensing transcriptional repressor [Erysipelotrichales bacterium]|nr:metal-sensing transcriptional repressor [Erysipelotrichales bacterium]
MKADKTKAIRLLKTARGQVDGIIKMVEEDRYCVDISYQLLAAQSLLKRVNKEIIGAHMKHCVHDAINNDDADKKIDEMISIIDELMK